MNEAVLICCFAFLTLLSGAAAVRVAVIGGGMTGASTAFHLRGVASEVVVFEASGRVGGRIEHVRLDGEVDIEAGASMWVRENRLLHALVRELQLRAVRRDETRRVDGVGVYSSGLSGIWNGRQFVFQSSVWRWLTPLRVWWRYGLAPLDVRRLVDNAIARFLAIYDEPVWNSTASLFERLRLVNETQTPLAALLQWNRVPQRYIDELASVAVRVNYGQSERRISAFAGLITLVAMSSECFQLDGGGNVQLVDAMLRAANATVRLRTPARSIEREQSMWQRVRSALGGAPDARFRVNGEPFDYVVIATPLELAPALRLPSRGSMRAFQTTHTVIVSGVPAVTHASTLGVESVLTTEAASEQAAFTSFALQFRYDNGTAVYKVFSRKEIADETLQEVFDGAFTVHLRRAWRAYPVLSPAPLADWATTVVDEEGLIYANAIESAVSTMETAALSGRNAARWIEQKVNQQQQL